jgi:hypothetical protein
MLRIANYYKSAAKYLEFNVISLDHNLILTTGKYLLWRVKNYIECAKAFGDRKAFEEAINVLTKGLQRVEQLKTIEEQDPPILDADKQAIDEAFRLLRTMQVKYELQSGKLGGEAWKKKVEETFPTKLHRSL